MYTDVYMLIYICIHSFIMLIKCIHERKFIMADTFTIRVNEQVQEKFEAFTDTGAFRNQGDFFSHLLTLYAAQETSIYVPTLESAINAVTDMADRVCKILAGAGETIISNQEKINNEAVAFRQEAEEKLKAMASENENLRTQNADCQMDLEITKKTYAKQFCELENQIKNLEKNLNDKVKWVTSRRIRRQRYKI